jgi:hypothetical protein
VPDFRFLCLPELKQTLVSLSPADLPALRIFALSTKTEMRQRYTGTLRDLLKAPGNQIPRHFYGAEQPKAIVCMVDG